MARDRVQAVNGFSQVDPDGHTDRPAPALRGRTSAPYQVQEEAVAQFEPEVEPWLRRGGGALRIECTEVEEGHSWVVCPRFRGNTRQVSKQHSPAVKACGADSLAPAEAFNAQATTTEFRREAASFLPASLLPFMDERRPVTPYQAPQISVFGVNKCRN